MEEWGWGAGWEPEGAPAQTAAPQPPPRQVLEVVCQWGGQQHVVGLLWSAEDASLVQDMLNVAQAVGAQPDLAALHLLSWLADGPGFRLSAVAAEEVQAAGFPGLLLQLQECVATQNAEEQRKGGVHRSLLYCAALLGHTAAMHLMLALLGPAPAAEASGDGQTPLFAAAMTRGGRRGPLMLLLPLAPEAATAQNSKQRSALFLAAERGHMQIVQLLAAAAPEMVATADDRGRSPLFIAAYKARNATFRFLLNQAPEAASAVTLEEKTVMHAAACGGDSAIMRLLLRAAAATATARGNIWSNMPIHDAVWFERPASAAPAAARCARHRHCTGEHLEQHAHP
ncbi:hypothetical protein ABPG75_000381 [Micractinium tetrahymenae]